MEQRLSPPPDGYTFVFNCSPFFNTVPQTGQTPGAPGFPFGKYSAVPFFLLLKVNKKYAATIKSIPINSNMNHDSGERNVPIPIRYTIHGLAATYKTQYTSRVASLYMVGTPIGNLGDITVRALEIFKAADYIACEDTRHTLGLLTHFEIRKPLISCRAQNEAEAARKIIGLLAEGKDVAYASDAGTPALSDPGAMLVKLVREAGYPVVPIPGASAFAVMVSIAGTGDSSVLFEGFLSPKQGRRKRRLQELFGMQTGFVLYESPFRIIKLLQDIADIDSKRQVVVGRELTKLHEEILSGSASDILHTLQERQSIKGEFSVFVSGKT